LDLVSVNLEYVVSWGYRCPGQFALNVVVECSVEIFKG